MGDFDTCIHQVQCSICQDQLNTRVARELAEALGNRRALLEFHNASCLTWSLFTHHCYLADNERRRNRASHQTTRPPRPSSSIITGPIIEGSSEWIPVSARSNTRTMKNRGAASQDSFRRQTIFSPHVLLLLTFAACSVRSSYCFNGKPV